MGMNVVRLNYRLGIGSNEQTVKVSIWDPAMTELEDTENPELDGIN